MTDRPDYEEQMISAATGIILLFVIIFAGGVALTILRFIWNLV